MVGASPIVVIFSAARYVCNVQPRRWWCAALRKSVSFDMARSGADPAGSTPPPAIVLDHCGMDEVGYQE